MSEHGPQGLNGISLADRTVRNLGIEVANGQIAIANLNARAEELREAASHLNFELWEEFETAVSPDEVDGQPLPAPGAKQYLVPAYQVDAVARLISMLQQQ